jgi:hypothetical protein
MNGDLELCHDTIVIPNACSLHKLWHRGFTAVARSLGITQCSRKLPSKMKCPHCLVEVHAIPKNVHLTDDIEGRWIVAHYVCPSPQCKRIVIAIEVRPPSPIGDGGFLADADHRVVHPPAGARPVPPEVPDALRDDYTEAAEVMYASPKASAALSRRCLQALLRDHAGVKPGNLASEIDAALTARQVPGYLAGQLDSVRHIGNFAAHPTKSTETGSVVEVEPGEAEWNLDVLDGLFDFFFVQPSLVAARKKSLNAKLEDAGKPTLD